MNIVTPMILGAISGLTIFLGLPLAFVKGFSQPRVRGFCTAMSTGILVFLLVEITAKVIDAIEDLATSVSGGFPVKTDLILYAVIFASGLFLGLWSLAWFEKRFIRIETRESLSSNRKLSLMIAIGIGLHNLSEGLAIGQAFSWGDSQFGWLLVTGFALHNATEGFGIVAPLGGEPVTWGFLGLMGLIGGGPTILGAVLGSFWSIKPVGVFFLSLASGSILYVIGELLHLGRKLKEETVVAAGLLTGFFLAFITDLIIHMTSGGLGGS
jgi:ZIP family zinc transporter